MRALYVLFFMLALCFAGACSSTDDAKDTTPGGNDTTAGDTLVGQDTTPTDTLPGEDTLAGEDTAAEDSTVAPSECVLTTASYIAMTRFVELKNADATCIVSFTVAEKDGQTVDWAGMVKSGDVLEVIEGWPNTNDKANVIFPCPEMVGGKCYAMEGTVTLDTFEITETEATTEGAAAGKKIIGSADVKATRAGNMGEAAFSFDLTF